MRTPDTVHLSPEDAELVRELYLERWADLPIVEATRVHITATPASHAERHARRAA